MKITKKLTSLLLALVMVLAMAGSALAANTTAHTITITNENAGHTYTAYQVFAGDISDGKLTNIVWGSGVDGAALLTALKGLENSPYTSCNTAEDVADVLVGFADDSAELDAFAKAVGANLKDAAGSSTETRGATSSTYVINVTGDGYYFVKDTGTIGSSETATKYILKVVENVEVAAKSETPTLDKVIVDADSDKDETPADENTDGNGTAQDVGSAVTFKLTSKVPEMASYDSYTYVVSDTLSDGLTFNNDVAVTIGGTEYRDFTVVQNGQTFTITFNNFIRQQANAGKEIVITYSATINENALSTDVETNTVYLQYSNNPNDSTSKGQTPPKTVYVYDFDLVIDKFAKTSETETKKLAGAKFVLYKTTTTGEGEDAVTTKYYYYYDEAADKVVWKPLTDTELEAALAANPQTVTEVTTDANGTASFRGLDAGTYYLHETESPSGYNLLKGDVEVIITATYGADGQITASSATSTNQGQYQQTESVENKSGATLPETGGMGTTIFYVLGGALVLAAIVLLVTRKRMSMKG